MHVDDAIGLGVKIIKKVSEGKVLPGSIEIGYIKENEGYHALSPEELEKYL